MAFDKRSQIYEDTKSEGDTIILETASADLMPHSIFLFLEIISHGVYDGMPWHTSANHVVQAGPSSNVETTKGLREEPSLQSVIFQEFDPSFPHDKYTIGFAGRPGGPDFYINLKDNHTLHGPGGQARHYGDVVEDADPCFARVVKGFSVIDRLHRSEVESRNSHNNRSEVEGRNSHNNVLYPASIERMRIVQDFVPIAEA